MVDARLGLHGWILMLLGIALIVNAFWMLAGPMHWYEEVPAGVPDTGPFNPHFVRDIGCAFLAAGVDPESPATHVPIGPVTGWNPHRGWLQS